MPDFWLLPALVGLACLLGEHWRPWQAQPWRKRWPAWRSHLLLTLLNQSLFLLLPFTLWQAATWLAAHPWHDFGLSQWPTLAGWLATLLLLDLALYWQHRWLHRLPWLWRLHRPHHTDDQLDVSSALRFHPLELGLSFGYKCLLLVILLPPAAAVLLFEMLLLAGALFTHANLALSWDGRLRPYWITPGLHRVHHSLANGDSQHNFGTLLTLWDRWFGSYRDKEGPLRLGDPEMGSPLKPPACQQLTRLLELPFGRARPSTPSRERR